MKHTIHFIPIPSLSIIGDIPNNYEDKLNKCLLQVKHKQPHILN